MKSKLVRLKKLSTGWAQICNFVQNKSKKGKKPSISGESETTPVYVLPCRYKCGFSFMLNLKFFAFSALILHNIAVLRPPSRQLFEPDKLGLHRPSPFRPLK